MREAALDPTIRTVLSVAAAHGQPPVPGLGSVSEWPWSLIALIRLQERLTNVANAVAVYKIPMPPNEIIFDQFWVNDWIETHKEKSQNA